MPFCQDKLFIKKFSLWFIALATFFSAFFVFLPRVAFASCWPVSSEYRCSIGNGQPLGCRPNSLNWDNLTYVDFSRFDGSYAWCVDYQCSDWQSLNNDCDQCGSGVCDPITCGGGGPAGYGCQAQTDVYCDNRNNLGQYGGTSTESTCRGNGGQDCNWDQVPNENVGRCWGHSCGAYCTSSTYDPATNACYNGCDVIRNNYCCNNSDHSSSTYVQGNGYCVNGSCQFEACGVRTATCSVCTVNTTTAYTSPSGTSGWQTYASSSPYAVTAGQTTIYVKGVNSGGVLSSLSASNTPTGWSQSPATSGASYSVNISGWALGSHTVSAAGGGGSLCASSGSSYFSCSAAAPTLTPSQPSGVVGTINPSSYSWTGSSWGMDSCGGNTTGNDTLGVKLYNGSGCAGAAIAQNLSCPTTSPCTMNYAGFVRGQNYSWQLIANNGASTQTTCTNFTYNPNVGPWWQVGSGEAYSQGSIQSLLPPSGLCSTPACYFNTDNSASQLPAGGVVYGGASANFNGGTVSSTSWLANSSANSTIALPSYDIFHRQVSVATVALSGDAPPNSEIQNCTVAPGADACYLEYTGSGTLTLSTVAGLDVGAKKVVVFVPSTAQKVVINGPVIYTAGQGFFGVVSAAPIEVVASSTVLNLSGLYFTDSTFTTKALGGSNADGRLTVTGQVIAKGGVSLNRDLDPAKSNGGNNTLPAEKFVFAPDLLFTLPRALKRVQYQLNELPPIDEIPISTTLPSPPPTTPPPSTCVSPTPPALYTLKATMMEPWSCGPVCRIDQTPGPSTPYSEQIVGIYRTSDDSLVAVGQTNCEGILYMNLSAGSYYFGPSVVGQKNLLVYTPSGFTITGSQITDINVTVETGGGLRCLSSWSEIDTPDGRVGVKDVVEGLKVWTINKSGQKVEGTVLKVSKTAVPLDHQVVHLVLADGRAVWVSPGHPTADGRVVGDLRAGERYDGSAVVLAELRQYTDGFTYDILPSGETGFYWADGVLLGSTLK